MKLKEFNKIALEFLKDNPKATVVEFKSFLSSHKLKLMVVQG